MGPDTFIFEILTISNGSREGQYGIPKKKSAQCCQCIRSFALSGVISQGSWVSCLYALFGVTVSFLHPECPDHEVKVIYACHQHVL